VTRHLIAAVLGRFLVQIPNTERASHTGLNVWILDTSVKYFSDIRGNFHHGMLYQAAVMWPLQQTTTYNTSTHYFT